ncbi:hypothetical protein P7C70_g6852, partial [Phenoliferia sp. Uapishka_3]
MDHSLTMTFLWADTLRGMFRIIFGGDIDRESRFRFSGDRAWGGCHPDDPRLPSPDGGPLDLPSSSPSSIPGDRQPRMRSYGSYCNGSEKCLWKGTKHKDAHGRPSADGLPLTCSFSSPSLDDLGDEEVDLPIPIPLYQPRIAIPGSGGAEDMLSPAGDGGSAADGRSSAGPYPEIPAAVTKLPSPPSASTSSALPHASHHLPSYENALQHLQGNPEMSSRDLDEAQPRKRSQPSSSVASGKALDQRNSARPGPPIQARARGGQFAGSKAGAASTKAVKQLDITFVLLPSSKRVLAAGPTGVPLFESKAWTLLKAAGYVRGKSLDPGPYFGVAMCHAAKELFGTKYTDEAGEQSPRFLLLQVVPYGAGRSAFQGTLVAQTDQEGVSRMLSSIATAADAELW